MFFVIPDAVLQCHKDTTESNIIEDCAKFLKYAPDTAKIFLNSRNKMFTPPPFGNLLSFAYENPRLENKRF
jgi:hypothetical protein